MIAVDLLAVDQTCCCTTPRWAGPALRYRPLHVAARLTRGGRRLRRLITATGPEPVSSPPFTRLATTAPHHTG